MRINKVDSLWDPVLNAHADYLEGSKEIFRKAQLNPLQILRDYATVRIGFGRQNGTSMYVAKTASPDDLVLVRDEYDLDLMKRRVAAFNHISVLQPDVLIVNSLIPENKTYHSVWINDASFLDPNAVKSLYENLAGRCKRFILVK